MTDSGGYIVRGCLADKSYTANATGQTGQSAKAAVTTENGGVQRYEIMTLDAAGTQSNPSVNIEYIRISGYVTDGAENVIITVNEEITAAPGAHNVWLDTGITYSGYTYVDRLESGAPLYAESLEWLSENGDQSKIYLLPNGHLAAYMSGATVPAFTNLVPTSIDTDGSIFNGVGYMDGYRGNSSGTVSALAGCTVTGLIPFNPDTDTVRIAGVDRSESALKDKNAGYVAVFREDRTIIAFSNPSGAAVSGFCWENYPYGFVDEDGAYVICRPSKTECYLEHFYNSDKAAKYIRLCGMGSGANMIVTINEEIKYTIGGMWADTGISYANYKMTDQDRDSIAQRVLEHLDVTRIDTQNVLTVGSYELRYEGASGVSSLGEVDVK